MRPSFKIIITLSIIFIIPSFIYYMNVKDKKIKKIEKFRTTQIKCAGQHGAGAHQIIHNRKYSFQERILWANRQGYKIDMDHDYSEADLKTFPSSSREEYNYFRRHASKHNFWKTGQKSAVNWYG